MMKIFRNFSKMAVYLFSSRRTDVTSFVCTTKKVDVGYCGKISLVRERGVNSCKSRGKGGGSVLENEVNIAGLLVILSTFLVLHTK